MSFALRISSALWIAGAAVAQSSAPVTKVAASHPNLSGIWQAMGTANWDLEDHAPEPGYQIFEEAREAAEKKQ